MSKRAKHEARMFWIFASPWIIGFLVFLAGPMIFSVYISLTEWDSFNPPVFVGLDNFVRLFTDYPLFWRAVGQTFLYAVLAVPPTLAIGVFLANLLNKRIKFRRFFRTMVYLPVLVPLVATAMVFMMVLAPSGPVNQFLGLFGIDGPHWLLDPTWVIPAIVMLALWAAGGATILLLSAMNGIPKEFYEAAEIAGAGPMRQFWSITFPQITPIIFFNLIMGMIGAFQVFGQVFILTGGGPDNASMMMVPLLFREGFQFFRFGLASAMAWVLFVIIMIFTALAFKTSKRWVFYETEVK